jgi:hypothetical protein
MRHAFDRGNYTREGTKTAFVSLETYSVNGFFGIVESRSSLMSIFPGGRWLYRAAKLSRQSCTRYESAVRALPNAGALPNLFSTGPGIA